MPTTTGNALAAVWTTFAWLPPYALFWLWVIALSVRFLTGRVRTTGLAPPA